MIYSIANEKVCAKIHTRGAELLSLYSKEIRREYMWQGAPEAWPNHSLLLFPVCGRTANSRVIVDGTEYPLPMHGFAKDMEFSVAEKGLDRLVLELRDNEETRAMYPYRFCLRVSFTLSGDTVVQKFDVINEDTRPIYFSLGAHPGFFCPLVLGEKPENYVLKFDSEQSIKEITKDPGSWLLTHETTDYLCGTEVPLSDHFFDNGPMILRDVKAKSVTLLSKESGRFVEMGIEDFPFMCLWGKGGRMQIICVEPWCGISDYVDADFQWESRFGNEKAEVGECFTRTLTFRLG